MDTKKRNLPSRTTLAILLFCLLIFPLTAHANNIEFEWQANPEPLTGYKLYYKTGPDNNLPYDGTGLTEGNSPITIGKVTSFAVSGLSPTSTYHFALKAYHETTESDFSTATITIQASEMVRPIIDVMSQTK